MQCATCDSGSDGSASSCASAVPRQITLKVPGGNPNYEGCTTCDLMCSALAGTYTFTLQQPVVNANYIWYPNFPAGTPDNQMRSTMKNVLYLQGHGEPPTQLTLMLAYTDNVISRWETKTITYPIAAGNNFQNSDQSHNPCNYVGNGAAVLGVSGQVPFGNGCSSASTVSTPSVASVSSASQSSCPIIDHATPPPGCYYAQKFVNGCWVVTGLVCSSSTSSTSQSSCPISEHPTPPAGCYYGQSFVNGCWVTTGLICGNGSSSSQSAAYSNGSNSSQNYGSNGSNSSQNYSNSNGGNSSQDYSAYSSIAPADCHGTCGNGTRECSEECDDGNTSNDDGCNNSCQLEHPYCGDYVIEARIGENCEPTLTKPSNLCDPSTCRLLSSPASSSGPVGYCCIDNFCFASQNCALTQNQCSNNCSNHPGNVPLFSSLPTTPTPSQSICAGDECVRGGNSICQSKGETCVTTNQLPCIMCLSGSASANSSTANPVYRGTLPVASQCSSNNQCASGLCQGGRCTSCSANNQCSGGLCQHGSCVSCSDDSQCSTHLCAGGQCIGCGSNQDCALGSICLNGNCTACANNNQCSTGLCVHGSCVGCGTKQACTNGSICKNGNCVHPLTLQTFCGNGTLDSGEECDNGTKNSLLPNAACRPDCTLSRCGDGVIDTPKEACDDGPKNGQPHDPCDISCHVVHSAGQVLPSTVIELPFTQPTQTVGIVLPTVTNTTTANLTAPSSPTPPHNTSSGPETLAIMAAGASAGYAFIRRKKKM